MRLETYYRILKHDPKGRLVKDSGLIPSRSYVIQFLKLLQGMLNYETVTATDVDNAETHIRKHDAAYEAYTGRTNAPINNATYGIVVGTNDGATAVDNEDYKLDTKILHGAGAGQLNYKACLFPAAPSVVGPNVEFNISRAFENTSGNTITVKEIGIICNNAEISKQHLLLRDVVTDEDVLDDYTLTVVYTLRTTV